MGGFKSGAAKATPRDDSATPLNKIFISRHSVMKYPPQEKGLRRGNAWQHFKSWNPKKH